MMAYSWVRRTQAGAVTPMVLPTTSSHSVPKGGGRRMAAEAPHTPRTTSASAHNTSRSGSAEECRSSNTGYYNEQKINRTGDDDDVRCWPAAMPRSRHHGVLGEQGCSAGDARSQCMQPTRPSGPCSSYPARRPVAPRRLRARQCASRTASGKALLLKLKGPVPMCMYASCWDRSRGRGRGGKLWAEEEQQAEGGWWVLEMEKKEEEGEDGGGGGGGGGGRERNEMLVWL